MPETAPGDMLALETSTRLRRIKCMERVQPQQAAQHVSPSDEECPEQETSRASGSVVGLGEGPWRR